MRRARSMRCASPLLITALTACASTPPGANLGGRDETARVTEAGAAFRIRPSESAAATTVAHPVDQVWRALPSVYQALGIPLTTVEAPQRVIGNSGMKVHKRLGDVFLSRYLDCGQAQGFPSAETYDVHMLVLTQLQSGENGATTVATMVDAAARPFQFRGDYSRCTSKGELEKRIADGVKAKLATP